MEERTDAPENSFERVAALDAEFRNEAMTQAFDSGSEVASLRSLLDGNSRAALVDACKSQNKDQQFEAADAAWQPWKLVDDARIGQALHAVTEELEAPHLKPSG